MLSSGLLRKLPRKLPRKQTFYFFIFLAEDKMADANFSQIHESVNGPSALKGAVDSLVNLNSSTGLSDFHILAGVSTTGIDSFISSIAQDGFFFVSASGINTECTLTVGADTAANATSLIQNFGLSGSGPTSRMIAVERGQGIIQGSDDVLIGNTSGSNTYVQFFAQGALAGGAEAMVFEAASQRSRAMINVSRLTSTVIKFNVVKTGSA
jgi:hypothetical protein